MNLYNAKLRIVLFIGLMCLSNFVAHSEQDNDASDFYQKAKDQVVAIDSFTNVFQKIKSGSGVIVASKGDNYFNVVTNTHVLSRGMFFRVTTSDAQVFWAQPLYFSTKTDFAILLCKGKPASIAKLADNVSDVKIGNKVYAIGNPLGLDRSLSDGLISGFRNEGDLELIQMTAPISPGSSGGGLYNKSGELIAITSAGMRNGQNLNLAIPLKGEIRNIIDIFSYFFPDSGPVPSRRNFVGDDDWDLEEFSIFFREGYKENKTKGMSIDNRILLFRIYDSMAENAKEYYNLMKQIDAIHQANFEIKDGVLKNDTLVSDEGLVYLLGERYKNSLRPYIDKIYSCKGNVEGITKILNESPKDMRPKLIHAALHSLFNRYNANNAAFYHACMKEYLSTHISNDEYKICLEQLSDFKIYDEQRTRAFKLILNEETKKEFRSDLIRILGTDDFKTNRRYSVAD